MYANLSAEYLSVWVLNAWVRSIKIPKCWVLSFLCMPEYWMRECLSTEFLSAEYLNAECLSDHLSIDCLKVQCLRVECLSIDCLSISCLSVECLKTECWVLESWVSVMSTWVLGGCLSTERPPAAGKRLESRMRLRAFCIFTSRAFYRFSFPAFQNIIVFCANRYSIIPNDYRSSIWLCEGRWRGTVDANTDRDHPKDILLPATITCYFRLVFPLPLLCPASVAQRQSVGLGIERTWVRNSLVPSGFLLRQGN